MAPVTERHRESKEVDGMDGENRHLVLAVTSETTARAFLSGLVDTFVADGWQVSVVTNASESLNSWARTHGAAVHSVPFARSMAPFQDLKVLIKLTAWMRRQNPAAVVSATPKAGLIATTSARIARVPVRLYQVWGLRLETVSGWQRRLLHLLERTAVSSATHVLANSRSLAAELVALGIAREGVVKVLGEGSSHGVDTGRFSPDCEASLDAETQEFLDKTPGDMTVTYVGRLHPDKGINTLVRAALSCLEQGVRVRLLMVGRQDGWDASDLPVEMTDLVYFAGPVPDPRAYILAADALSLPTRREGFPNVVLEAAALGVPTVTTRATGAVDSVVDGETGYLVAVDDPDELADRLVQMSRDRAELSRMGHVARQRVLRHFRKEYVEKLQRDFLRQAVAGGCTGKS